jgi:hypothetical protein
MRYTKMPRWLAASVLFTLYCNSCTAAPAVVPLKWKTSDAQWKDHVARTVADIGVLSAEPGVDSYGGRLDRSADKTGFFHVSTIGGRWWLVDPDGHLYLFSGMVSVGPSKNSDVTAWAPSTTKLLRDNGFNGLSAWSHVAPLEAVDHPMVYTVIGHSGLPNDRTTGFMTAYSGPKHISQPGTGHADFPGGCIPVFNPDFATFCDDYAKPLARFKDDPNLLGYFTDNELPMPKLENYLALDPNDPNLGPEYAAARAWFTARKGASAAAADITDDDRDAWAELVFDRYYQLTTSAIRKYDPNHLCLGSKVDGHTLLSHGVFVAAGRYLDVISIDYYGVWSPPSAHVQQWTQWSGKPVLAAEFYAKGADTGMGNTSGAGWLVPTQEDRGLFYETYTLGLIEAKNCVGWSWFKYMDNDPNDKNADPSNRDSNKGIVTIDGTPYAPLLNHMKALNDHIYAAADKFDTAPAAP